MTNTTTMIENASDMVMAILYFLQSLMCLFLLSQLQRRREQKRIRKYFFLLCFTAGMLRCLWFAIPDSVFAQGYLPQNRTPTDFGGQAFLLNLLQFSLYSAPNILYFTMWCLLICFWSSLIHLMFSSLQSPMSPAQSNNQSMDNGLLSPFSSPIRGNNDNGPNGVLVVKPFAGNAESGTNAPSPIPYPTSSTSGIPRARLIPYTPALNFFRITTVVVCVLQLLLIGGLFLFDFFNVLVATCVFVSTLALFSLVCYITYAIVTLKKLRPMYMRWYEQHKSRGASSSASLSSDTNGMLFKDSIHQPLTPNRANSSFPELEEEDEHVDHRAAARLIRSPLEHHSIYPGHASSGLDRDENDRGMRGSAYRSQLDRPHSRSSSTAGKTSSSSGDQELSVSPSHSAAVMYQSLHSSTNPPPNFHLMNRTNIPVGTGSLTTGNGASNNSSSILRQPSISLSVSHGPNPSLASSSGHSSLPSQTRTSNNSSASNRSSNKSSERSTVSQPNQHVSASDELSYQPHSYDEEHEDDDDDELESEAEDGEEEQEQLNGAVPIAQVESKEDSNLVKAYASESEDEELDHTAGPDGALPLNGHRSLRSSPVLDTPQQLLQQQQSLPPIPQPISSNRSSLSSSPILRVDKEAIVTQSAVQARLSSIHTDDDAVVREEDFFMASPSESPSTAIPAALRRPNSANAMNPDGSNNRSAHRYATPPRNSHLPASIAASPMAPSPRISNSSAIVDKEIDAERYIAMYSWNQTRRICMLTLCVTLCGGARIVSSLVELHYTLRQIDDADSNPTGDGSSDFPDYWWLYIDSYYLLFELLSSSVATWILTQSSVQYAASQRSSAEHNHGINQPAPITIIPSSGAPSGSSASSTHPRFGTSAPTTPQRVQVKSSYQYPSKSPTGASNASAATFGYYSSSLGGSAMLGPHSSSALSSSLQVRLLGGSGGISGNNQNAAAIAASKISPRLHHHYTSAGSTPVFVASDSQRRENLRQIFKP